MISIKDKKDCCGCTACAEACPVSCISMVRDSEGFLYPSVNSDACINCGKCSRVCPVINKRSIPFPQKAYILRNKNAEAVRVSTSGGAVSVFAKAVIDDGGIVFGGAFGEDYYVEHRAAETIEALEMFKSSKYVQCDPKNSFSDVKRELSSGRKVMFAGTPCQVAGLKNHLGKEYDNLFTVDFVCRAVPSPLVWEKYRLMMEKKHRSKLSYACFREKTYGYHSSNMSLRFENGKKHLGNTRTDYYLKSFFEGINVRPSCFDCSFRQAGRVSDLTVFDCWDITRYVPSVRDDDKGYTACFVQSEKGQKMLDLCTPGLTCYSADANTLVKHCGHMAVENPDINPNRDRFFEMINDGMSVERAMQTISPVSLKHKAFAKLKPALYRLGLLRLLK